MIVNIVIEGNRCRFIYKRNKDNINWNFHLYELVHWMEEDDYYAPLMSTNPVYIREAINTESEQDKNKKQYSLIINEAKELLNYLEAESNL